MNRIVTLSCWLVAVIFLIAGVARAGTPPDQKKIFVIGFVGGLRSPDDFKQGVVQIGRRLKQIKCKDLDIAIYSHFHWKRAYEALFEQIDLDHDGKLSEVERRRIPDIVIFGHSLGGWAVVRLARRLERDHIPVDLTVQLDTVGIGDAVVPGNVRTAMNFYQRTEWPVRGEREIRAASPTATVILGNVLIRHVAHEALATRAEVSDFITDRVQALCDGREVPPRTITGAGQALSLIADFAPSFYVQRIVAIF